MTTKSERQEQFDQAERDADARDQAAAQEKAESERKAAEQSRAEEVQREESRTSGRGQWGQSSVANQGEAQAGGQWPMSHPSATNQGEADKKQATDKADADARAEEEKQKQISPDVVGSTLSGHLNKYRTKRQEHVRPDTPHPEQQQADERAMRHLVADLIVSHESSVLKVLTEAEQAQARALAAKLKAS